MVADDTPMPLKDIGSVVTPTMSLSYVYFIPDLRLNLISVSRLCDYVYLVSFSFTTCYVMDPRSQKVIVKGRN